MTHPAIIATARRAQLRHDFHAIRTPANDTPAAPFSARDNLPPVAEPLATGGFCFAPFHEADNA